MGRYPKFRFGEVVRVVQAPSELWGNPAVVGMEGVVSGIGPLDDGAGWSFSVRLSDDREDHESFEEHELESAGLVELEEGEPASRVPLDPTTHAESFDGEVGVVLYKHAKQEDAATIAERAQEALRTLIPFERVTWTGDVYWDADAPYRFDIRINVSPRGEARAAFETLVASQRTGWKRLIDDGWSCDFGWFRQLADGEQPFLVDEAFIVGAWLRPWNDPSQHPVKRGRTHDPGLPGYTPPEPPAGYET